MTPSRPGLSCPDLRCAAFALPFPQRAAASEDRLFHEALYATLIDLG